MVLIRYIGRRIAGDKTYHAFLHGEEEVFFEKSKYVRIGQWYEARHTKKDGLGLSSRPEWKEGPAATEEEIAKWDAQDLLATREIKRRNLARRMRTHPAIIECAERLKPLVKGLGYSERKDIVEFLMDELEKEERKKFEETIKAASRKIVRDLKRRAKK